MTQVWVVRYDEGMYLFKDIATAEQSIADMYKGESCTFDHELVSDQVHSVIVMKNGRVQDQVKIIAADVHEHPTVIHRYVTEIDEPEDYDRPPQKPPRQEF